MLIALSDSNRGAQKKSASPQSRSQGIRDDWKVFVKKSDFDEYDWQSLIAECEPKEWLTYSNLFLIKVDEAVALGDEAMRRVFSELQSISHTHLPIDDSEPDFFYPFPPPDDLVQAFTDMVPEIIDCDMRALLADAAQSYKRDHIIAQIAIEAYVESAIRLQDLQNWLHSASRLRRAVNIAAAYGSKKKKNPLLEKAIAEAEKIVVTYQGDDPRFLTETALVLLLRFPKRLSLETALVYASYAGNAAKRAEADHDWHRARRYWQLQADWYRQFGDEAKQLNALEEMVETYVSAAEDALKGSSPYIYAASWIHSAIRAYNNLGGFQWRVQELQIVLDEYQQKSRSEYKPMMIVMDISPFAAQAQSQVQGKSWQEALNALVNLDGIPSKALIHELLVETARKAPLSYLLPIELVRARGKVFENIPSGSTDSQPSANAAAATEAREYIEARKMHELFALSSVEPARQRVVQEHTITPEDISSLIASSSFVPSDRIQLYTKGLWNGLQGDFMIASHLLIPQIEESMRHILRQNGILSTNFTSQGIQDERPLGETLHLFETVALDVLDSDLLFTIKGFLHERAGSNMRNDLGHGLLNDAAFGSGRAIYAWWLALKLCLLPQLQQNKNN